MCAVSAALKMATLSFADSLDLSGEEILPLQYNYYNTSFT